MSRPIRKTPPPYHTCLSRSERQRFAVYSRAPIDHEIALLRLLNERNLMRLSDSCDPEEGAALEQKITQTAVMIARLMQIRERLGQASPDERLAEIAAGLRQAFTRSDTPNHTE